ncbi:MAG: acyl-CoA dehydrogenase family protein [Betaproteobacteria bacterium]
MDFELSVSARAWRDRVQAFFDSQLLPRNREWHEHVVRRDQPAPFMGELQASARAEGLWNLGLPELAASEPGTRLSNLEYAGCCEILGRLAWAPEALNCQAPDVPNMITLQNCANAAQKVQWLAPLLEARTRSCFAMTEPDVASSDATNIATTIERQGGEYVVSGRKWFSTGAAHPNCTQIMLMGVTGGAKDAKLDRTRRHSIVMVPMDARGVRLVREVRWMGSRDHVAPIGEIEFDAVRVPVENRLGEEGDGFKIAQVRLGPARVHHCMRQIGLAGLMIELMLARAAERRAFGRTIIEYDTLQRWIAESRVELEQARLLTLKCAWLLDRQGHHGAWREVSLVKVAVPNMLQRVADRAIQVFGAMGGTDDAPIHYALSYARLMRIGDGPDEVHLRQVFRMETPPAWKIADSPYITAAGPA